MSKKRLYLCGVPETECVGGKFKGSNSYRGTSKVHGSREQAFKCHVRWLIKKGFKQMGAREFLAPPEEGGRVRVLTKKSRFGSELRLGKEGTRFMYDDGKGTITG